MTAPSFDFTALAVANERYRGEYPGWMFYARKKARTNVRTLEGAAFLAQQLRESVTPAPDTEGPGDGSRHATRSQWSDHDTPDW
ncbi:hypothetical protein [Robbsia andropogonis]|uniref:hypothetical protein n=1 Tax=Robbsia andropogonis TaxID=28092 RepID=UPI0004639FDD|nr:hypothetical protein [Robbsia andropogonis]